MESIKIDFEVEILNFEKSSEILSEDVGWAKIILWDPGSGLETLWIMDALQVISQKIFLTFFRFFFQAFSKDFRLFLKKLQKIDFFSKISLV